VGQTWLRPLIILLLVASSACGRRAPRFSLENARAHVQVLAGTIGSRPIGTPENLRARQYIVDQLRLYGFEVRVQETDARRPDLGETAHVGNIIAVKPGADATAVALLSHYDSVPEAPGAADDGLGVAVSLEAARVLAARADRRHTLFVLVTDGEEAGLMGAAGLTADREVMDRVQAYINIEATGSAGPALLFETGPANGWIAKAWSRNAPHPRGASYAIEIYRRLPNDTDFSILKRRDIPGLNFAAIGDSYPYHTARDTPDRLTDEALLHTGENTVATAIALDALDLRTRSAVEQTYFDIGGTVAVTWGPVTAWFIAALSLVCGLLAWFKVLAASVRLAGLLRYILDVVWAIAGSVFAGGAMIGGTWALRLSRTVYHPWYAHPERLFLMLLAIGTLAGWLAIRAGALLPRRAHAPRHPMFVWSIVLPFWIVLAGVTGALMPGAAYLWTLPLLAAGLGLLAVPVTNVAAVRAISVVVLAVAGTLWLRDVSALLRFVVALMGRLPLITPVWLYPAIMLGCGAMVIPPFIAAIAATRQLLTPALATAALLVATAVTVGFAYAAPAYTFAQPQRRAMRVLIEPGASTATYEVASQEPGLDLDAGGPGGWVRAVDAPKGGVPFSRLAQPFVFRTTAASPGPAPAQVREFSVKPVAAGTELAVTIVPQSTGLTVAFVLPEGVLPSRSNFPGIVQRGRWRALFVGMPIEGVTWRASFKTGSEAKLPATAAVIWSSRFPGGSGWQSLPSWMPQERTVWHLDVAWVLNSTPAIAPVTPLR
jgi:hypothetical protein